MGAKIWILRKTPLLLQSKSHCGVEQLVARWAHNPKVTGSSPVPATKSRASLIGGAFFMSEKYYSVLKTRFNYDVLPLKIIRP